MTYNDIRHEINRGYCDKRPHCYVDAAKEAANDCPYFDLCYADYHGPNNGNSALETALLARYMELKTGKPHHKFYFTFGSDPGFPMQDAYIIVLAPGEAEAVAKFREKYPDRREGIVNCAFWYSEDRWHGTPNEDHYGDPAEVFA